MHQFSVVEYISEENTLGAILDKFALYLVQI